MSDPNSSSQPVDPAIQAELEQAEARVRELKARLEAEQAAALAEAQPVPAESAPVASPAAPETEVALPRGPVKVERISLADAERADSLIRQSQVSFRRGDAKDGLAKVQEAFAIAPQSTAVLEALGDAYMAAGEPKRARDAYRAGLEVAPGHQTLEAKYAEAVLRLEPAFDPAVVAPVDAGSYANGQTAVLLSAILPGLGHLVLGETAKGIAFLASYIAFVVLAFLFRGPQSFFSLFGQAQDMNGFGLLMLGAALLAYLWCVFDMASLAKRMKPPKFSRPVPPVDKPF